MSEIKETLTFHVEKGNAGYRLDQYLKTKLPEFSRSRIQSLIEEGFVFLDGRKAKPATKLRGGEKIIVHVPKEKEYPLEPQMVPFEILYEDEDLAVIFKPSGVVVHPAPGHQEKTLVHGLLLRLKSLSGIGGVLRPGIVHRLDKDTSGLMLIAKNDETHKKLTTHFKERKIEKEYLTLVYGRLNKEKGKIETFLGRHPIQRKKMAILKEGRLAITEYQVLRYFKRATLILARPITGRTHQIRVHFSHLGHPILGDPLYGGLKPDLPRPPRLMLHAYRLSFFHPRTGEKLSFTYHPPPDFSEYIKSLEAKEG